MKFAERLTACENFSCIFGIVKEAVQRTINMRRGGLLLGLTDLPGYVGAFYQVGSNFIVMNRKLLADVIGSGNRELINAYVFHILLHEYLHTLGFMNESQASLLTREISEEVLGSGHPATLIAKHGIGHVIPNAGRSEHYRNGGIREMEIIEDFEMDDLDYLG